jgi:hypothetical protein
MGLGKWVGIVEIKAPYYVMYDPKKVKASHMCQMQGQLYMTGMPWCDYCYALLDHDDPEATLMTAPFAVVRVYYSRTFCEKILIPRLMEFTQCLVERRRPTLDMYDRKAPNTRMIKREILTVESH